MRHSKWRQNKISTFNFDFTIKPLQKVCLKKIVEGDRCVYCITYRIL